MKRWRNKQEFKARVREWAIKLGANVATIYGAPDAPQVGIMLDSRKPQFQQ